MKRQKECKRENCIRKVDQANNIRRYGRNHATTKYGFCSITCYKAYIEKKN